MPISETTPETVATPAKPGQGIVLFDGHCAFCKMSISIIQKLDWFGKLHMQSARNQADLPPCDVPLDLEKIFEEMHLVTPDHHRAYAGFSAFRWMAWRLPLTALFAPFMYLPGVLWVGNRIYRLIARNRFNLVPCHDGACAVPRKPS
jgi:predicted DCC family thiol-disulfide oxidoreductase YuxK